MLRIGYDFPHVRDDTAYLSYGSLTHMDNRLLILLAVAAVAVLGALAGVVSASANRRREPDGKSAFPDADAYTTNTSLLSDAERTFLSSLDRALPPNTRVFVQVALSALISPRRGSETRQRDWNRIAQKVVDFVVCDQWAKPLVVIELDDASHKRAKRVERDETLDSILRNVGVRLLRIRAAGSYDVEALRAELLPMESAV